MKKKISNKQLTKIAVIAIVAVLIILGGTYAWLRIGLSGTNTNRIKAGALDLRIDESPTSGETVRLERAIPQSYRQGITNPPYRFTIVNNSSMDTDYTLTLEDLYEGADSSLTANDKIADNLIRYILVKNDEEMIATNSKLLSTGRTIETGTIAGKSGNTATEIPYTLYIWIDSKAGDNNTQADIMNKIFNARLSITAEQHHTSNVNYKSYAIGDKVYYNPITSVYCSSTSEANCYEWLVVNEIENELDLMYLRESGSLEASINNAFVTMEAYTSGWSDELTVDESYDIPSSGSYAGYNYNKARLPEPDDFSEIIDQKLQEYNIAIASGVVGIPIPTVVLNYNDANYGVRYYGGGNTLMWQTAPLTYNYVTTSGYALYVHPIIRVEKEQDIVNTSGTTEETPIQDLWEPMYFAYRRPTIEDTEYPLNYDVFAAMNSVGRYGVCARKKDGSIHCFQANNASYERTHMQEVFSDIECQESDKLVYCNDVANDLICEVFTSGFVMCENQNYTQHCAAYENGNVACGG